MKKLPNHTALKEWASVIAALEGGEHFLLLRKGGIAESRFAVEEERFYLFPTYLHQREKQFKPGMRHYFQATDLQAEPAEVTLSSWCEVVRSWTIPDFEMLGSLEPWFIFTHQTLEERFRFRPEQRLQLLAVRVFRLAKQVSVDNLSEYAGCRSWISLEAEVDVDSSEPVLPEAELQSRIGEVNAVFQEHRQRLAAG